jgi:hypothetical protein
MALFTRFAFRMLSLTSLKILFMVAVSKNCANLSNRRGPYADT